MGYLITFEPRLLCQYSINCINVTNKAIIWTHTDLGQPLRWIMMPVCKTCLLKAKATYKINGNNAQPSPSTPSITKKS